MNNFTGRAGVHSGPTQQKDEPSVMQLAVSSRTQLAHIAINHVLFTHGLMFTHGNWCRDVVYDYLVEGGIGEPAMLTLPKKMFVGMTAKDADGKVYDDWNYKLLVLPKLVWQDFWNFMCTIGGVNPDTRKFHKLLAQKIPVPDILAIENSAATLTKCPMVDIYVFGIDGNDRQVFVSPAMNPPLDKPMVRVSKPDPDIVTLADRYFSEEALPYEPFDIRSGEQLTRQGLRKQKKPPIQHAIQISKGG